MLEARPPLEGGEVHAVHVALELAREREKHPAYRSAWRRAAFAESTVALDERPGENGYALSPRSTRGATRA